MINFYVAPQDAEPGTKGGGPFTDTNQMVVWAIQQKLPRTTIFLAYYMPTPPILTVYGRFQMGTQFANWLR